MKIMILLNALLLTDLVESFVLPRQRVSSASFTFLRNSSCYHWNVPADSESESGLISDLLLELGAESVILDIPSSGVETDDEFEKTGRLRSIVASQLKFTTLNDEKAELLVQQVCDILGIDGREAWKSQCTRHLLLESNDSSDESKVMWEPTIFDIDDKVLFVHSTLELSNEAFAFGDGNHATTRVSMRGLEKYVTEDAKVLDYGCGTGILGLTARALGASTITAVDISPQALEIAEMNWRLNYPDCQDFAVMSSADFVPCGVHDVVVANIPANTLVDLLDSLVVSMDPNNGVLLLAGYPSTESKLVSDAAALRHGLIEVDQLYDSGWSLLVFQLSKGT